ncbi:hypothetical protein ILYODFUR_032477 [Ilyodon furcidens]|uniref:Uncharacterized protein n=1 Tax=Ilyodon furcidens TaxID=33524 RepID=A0ABV0T4S6_9TELE
MYFCVIRFLVFTFQFIMLTYIFMLAWLGVTAFTSIPVFIYFNIWNICQNATGLEGASLCLDPRQYGIVPLAEAKTVCAGSEKFYKMCESTELDMTFHLFICALAGAGVAVIAMNPKDTTEYITSGLSRILFALKRKRIPLASGRKLRTKRWETSGILLFLLLIPWEIKEVDRGKKAFGAVKETGIVSLPLLEATGMSCCCHGNSKKKGSENVANITR